MKYVQLNQNTSRKDMSMVIVLDIDNTLYQETPEILESKFQVVRGFSGELNMEKDEFLQMCMEYEARYNSMIKGLRLHHTVGPEVVEKIMNCKVDLEGLVTPNARTRSILESSMYPVYCLTNGNLGHSTDALRALGLLHCIDGLFCTDYSLPDIMAKPDPRAFGCVMDRLGLGNDAKVLFFDDNIRNVEGAIRMGWIGVHVDHSIPFDELLGSKLGEHLVLDVAEGARAGR
jgi:pyrimidine 5'-nucleotidase